MSIVLLCCLVVTVTTFDYNYSWSTDSYSELTFMIQYTHSDRQFSNKYVILFFTFIVIILFVSRYGHFTV